jgi:phenylacetate-coenzyme A ligase PaaK-like adenylate-forming protein
MIFKEITALLDSPLYTMNVQEKNQVLTSQIIKLFQHHYESSVEFRNMMDSSNFSLQKNYTLNQLPFLPVRLFKLLNLVSVKPDQIIKTMTSSGTTGQLVSKIALDKDTSSIQTKTLVKIVSNFLGSTRLPMIIVDCESTIKNRNTFSARAAGILGFSIFSSNKIFALKEDMSLDIDAIELFIHKNKNKSIFLFGFTYIIHKHFFQELNKLNKKLNLENSIMIHGGGWKKLIDDAVDSSTFKSNLKSVANISKIHDYYGMVEQTGSIHMECEYGYLHTSEFSEIIIRNPKDFSVCKFGESGLIQLLSLLPFSYPGHSILTEDLGVIYGEDNCKCGRMGKYFKVFGRLKQAEIRGCSDTFTSN